jgi:phosphate transport system substrate-binding protein
MLRRTGLERWMHCGTPKVSAMKKTFSATFAKTPTCLIGMAFAASIACGGAAPRPVEHAMPPSLPPSPGVVTLRLHGSNTVGAELGPSLAEAFLVRRHPNASVVRSRTGPDEMFVEAREGDRPVDAVEVAAHGSDTAFEDLADRKCDVGMASRRIKEAELAKLASIGNLASAASERVIALDGIAIVVNPVNPVSRLTTSQIADIFSGKIGRWSELGPKDGPIIVHARDDKSGTFDTFKHVVLGSQPLVKYAIRHESSEQLSDAVATDDNAIGFIGVRYVRSAKPLMVEDAGSTPLLPSPMTISTEDYPLARRLYLYLPSTASQTAKDFVDFATSDAGQDVVQGAGFVDLRPECHHVPECDTCSTEYRSAVGGGCRMSLDFRFNRGSTQLDTRAVHDLARVANMMGHGDYGQHLLVLLGFSDAGGSYPDNLALSRKRAAVVAAQLKARGLRVDVERGLGPEMPVADNATEEGRDRNRRVEVWLR